MLGFSRYRKRPYITCICALSTPLLALIIYLHVLPDLEPNLLFVFRFKKNVAFISILVKEQIQTGVSIIKAD
jgi:hypothetical protein